MSRLTRSATATPQPRRTNRALPGHYVTLIRDGDPHSDRRQRYGRLVSIAMSAQHRGWSQGQWRTEIAANTDEEPSQLWEQVVKDARGSRKRAYKTLASAWAYAEAFLADNGGTRNLADFGDDAEELAHAWLDALDDPELLPDLTLTERTTLAHMATQLISRRMTRVTVPVRDLAPVIGGSIMTASRALGALTDKGWLTRIVRGTHGPQGATGTASIYAFASAPGAWLRGAVTQTRRILCNRGPDLRERSETADYGGNGGLPVRPARSGNPHGPPGPGRGGPPDNA